MRGRFRASSCEKIRASFEILVTVVPSTDPERTETALQAWEGSVPGQQPDTFVRAVRRVILMCICTAPREFTSQHHLIRNPVTEQSHKSLTRNKERCYTADGSGDSSHIESKAHSPAYQMQPHSNSVLTNLRCARARTLGGPACSQLGAPNLPPSLLHVTTAFLCLFSSL